MSKAYFWDLCFNQEYQIELGFDSHFFSDSFLIISSVSQVIFRLVQSLVISSRNCAGRILTICMSFDVDWSLLFRSKFECGEMSSAISLKDWNYCPQQQVGISEGIKNSS